MKQLLKRIISSKLGGCLFAGVWFAFAAVIPVAYCLIRLGDGLPNFYGDSQSFIAVIPILIGGFCGIFLGSTILDVNEIKSEFQAMLRGLLVAVLSFLLLFTLSVTIIVFTFNNIFDTVMGFAVIFLYGLFLVGWLVAIVGVGAGLLLYIIRLQVFRNTNIGEN